MLTHGLILEFLRVNMYNSNTRNTKDCTMLLSRLFQWLDHAVKWKYWALPDLNINDTRYAGIEKKQ
jgi:hypothetical protein